LKQLVYSEPDDVSSQLARFNLTKEDVRDALAFAEAYAADCTEHDPPMSSGFYRWGKTIRFLRDLLVPQGWVSRNEKLFTVDNDRTGISITVSSGDDATADPDRSPTTKYPRGAASIFAIGSNEQGVFNLPDFEHIKKAQEAKRNKAKLNTWWLLVYRTKTGARCELSFPVEVTKSGQITRWKERIIIGELEYGPGAGILDLPNYDSGPGFDIEVKAHEN
jgi:hypothetical protein